MLQSRPLCPALYAISVRRLRTLPAASFRFHLTMDPPAVRLTLPTTKRVVDFHHQAIAQGGRTTKRAARFRRVALKKLLSVFAEQPLCLPWHIYIIPHPFAKFNTILSNFVQIRPHLSKFVQPALESRKNKKIFTACPIPFLPRSVRSERRVDNSRTVRQCSICREMLTVIAGRRFWENEWHKERTRLDHLADHRKRNFE